ncbi:MAG TPA: M15 family metallopeptidase [Gammaproteobacteria bacterium]|nr:M15 family metallopeptidase [Gammaproteobacteria bacterium]
MTYNRLILSFLLSILFSAAYALPEGFVYLRDIDPTIIQEIRYSGYHNFIGHPVPGYQNAECVLTRPAAEALKSVQLELRKKSLSLKVYDCYRPQSSVNYFIEWSKDPSQQQAKQEFYPRVNKKDVFKLGYVAEKSGHSRGSTVDLTIIPLPAPSQPKYRPGQSLVACFAPYNKRYKDNSLDMGTGYDCIDESANIDFQNINETAYKNRLMFNRIMVKYGFVSFPKEWWHFTFKNEPYPRTYFDFKIAR